MSRFTLPVMMTRLRSKLGEDAPVASRSDQPKRLRLAHTIEQAERLSENESAPCAGRHSS